MKRMLVLLSLAAITAISVVVLTSCNKQKDNTTTPAKQNSGSCGENLHYEFDTNTGTLTISGTGDMTSRPWKDFTIKRLVLEEGITSICETAFYSKTELKGELVLPSTLKSIGEFAFYSCPFSGDLIIPEGVERIEQYTFQYADFDGKLVLPSTLKYIGEYAFSDVKNISGPLLLPEGLETIEYCAFSGCGKLTGDLVIPDSVTKIGGYSFQNCGFQGKLKLSENIEDIPLNCFCDTELSGELIIPDSVKTIGNNAFIGTNFNGKLQLPASLESIGKYAFFDLSGFSGELVIPEKVVMIDSNAFSNCDGFSSLKLSNGLKYICDSAFSNCTGLSGELTLPEKIQFIGSSAFSGCEKFVGELKLPEGLISIGNGAFFGCEGFSGNLILPESLLNIGSYSFEGCSGLSGSIDFPEAFAVLQHHAFLDCKEITEMTFGSGIRSIGSAAAAGCDNLKRVIFKGEVPDFYAVDDEDGKASFPPDCDLGSAVPKDITLNRKNDSTNCPEGDEDLGVEREMPWTWLNAMNDSYDGIGKYADLYLYIVDDQAVLITNDHEKVQQTASITADENDENQIAQLSGLYVDDMLIQELAFRQGIGGSFIIAKGVHTDGTEEEICFCSSSGNADQYYFINKDQGGLEISY